MTQKVTQLIMLTLRFLVILDTVGTGLKSTSLTVSNVAIRYTASESGSHSS
jgi:hypothetical protein